MLREFFGTRPYDSFLGLVPLPPDQREKNYHIAATTFDFDSMREKSKELYQLCQEYLILEGEDKLTGNGGVVLAFYDKEDGGLMHLCVGRGIAEPNGDRAYLGLRYSMFTLIDGELRHIPMVVCDAWPMPWSDAKAQIPRNRLAMGHPTLVNPAAFVALIKELFGIQENIKLNSGSL